MRSKYLLQTKKECHIKRAYWLELLFDKIDAENRNETRVQLKYHVNLQSISFDT